jgi:hypothetical protein
MIRENTSKTFKILFGETANEVAGEVNFIRRQRNLTGSQFSKTVILGLLENPNASRTEMASIAVGVGKQLTPQSLDARLQSEEATLFFKTLLDKVLNIAWLKEKAILPECLGLFEDIILNDASIVPLPDVLEDLFPTGKKLEGQRSGAKIHARYSFVSKQVSIVLTPAQVHDQKIEWLPKTIEPKQLFLMDLGYYKLASFEQISNADAYFITRYKTGTCLFDESGKKIDLVPYLAKHNSFDLPVEIGVSKRIKGRLVGYKIGEEEANERRRLLKRQCQSRGTKPSKESLLLCDYVLLLTNVAATDLVPKLILDLAKVRWQIELLFKCWKSHLNQIHTWTSANRQVILCMFYAKLLGCLCQQCLYLEASWNSSRQSLFKSVKAIRTFIPRLIKCVENTHELEALFVQIKDALLVCSVAKRKNKATFQCFEVNL